METIMLREDLRKTLEQNAERESRDVNELVNEAVERYLREQRHVKLEKEIAAYEAMHPMLKQNYFEQWVAIHEGQLVDHDVEGDALYQRVRARYGHLPVLIRQVAEEPVEEIWMRTWSTGKIEA